MNNVKLFKAVNKDMYTKKYEQRAIRRQHKMIFKKKHEGMEGLKGP